MSKDILIEKRDILYKDVRNQFVNFEKENNCKLIVQPCEESKYFFKIWVINQVTRDNQKNMKIQNDLLS